MNSLEVKRVLITGGNGFLGKHLKPKIQSLGCEMVFDPMRQNCDLRNAEEIKHLLDFARPDVIIHLAAVCGGIGANQAEPGRFFYENAIMGIQLIEQARLAGVDKFVCVGTVCSYPKHCPIPFKEDDIWNGYPEETNAPYGLAKKMLMVQLQAYHQQYGMKSAFVIPVNLYGPGDNFDLKTSHVIPAMIRKLVEAKDKNAPEVSFWGTGGASREFLYVEDCCDGIIKAAEVMESPEPINLGTGNSISIISLATLIARIVGYEGQFIWDASKPDGQPLRQLDVQRARKLLNFYPSIELAQGIEKTVKWYMDSK